MTSALRFVPFCVWDLEILWHERNAYVRTILSPEGASPEAYLSSTRS